MNKNDRRAKRTQKLLREGLAELMKTKNVKDITVTELTDFVDINRGTFYLHYLDIYDLLEHIENDMFEEFNELLKKYPYDEMKKEPLPILEEIFTFLANNSDVCIVLLGDNGDMAFFEKIKKILKDQSLHDWMQLHNPKDTKEYEYFYAFIVTGCVGVLSRWLESGMIETPEEMAKLVEQICLNGLKCFD